MTWMSGNRWCTNSPQTILSATVPASSAGVMGGIPIGGRVAHAAPEVLLPIGGRVAHAAPEVLPSRPATTQRGGVVTLQNRFGVLSGVDCQLDAHDGQH